MCICRGDTCLNPSLHVKEYCTPDNSYRVRYHEIQVTSLICFRQQLSESRMTISSRTPEGEPQRCSICGKLSTVDPSFPCGDSCCPNCGNLLWWVRDRLSQSAGISIEAITPSSSLVDEFGLDSTSIVELVMELEEKYGITIPDDEAEQIKTVADAIRIIQRYKQD